MLVFSPKLESDRSGEYSRPVLRFASSRKNDSRSHNHGIEYLYSISGIIYRALDFRY